MWVIFLLAMMVFTIIALTMIWLGSLVIRSIQRADRKFERENEEYENAKKKENER